MSAATQANGLGGVHAGAGLRGTHDNVVADSPDGPEAEPGAFPGATERSPA